MARHEYSPPSIECDGEPVAWLHPDTRPAAIAQLRALFEADERRERYLRALQEIDCLEPSDFMDGQDHLPPAFRVPNFAAAMKRVAEIVDRALDD